MLCEKCKKSQAVIFLSQVIGQEKKQICLCEECARTHTNYIENPHIPIDLQELLKSIWGITSFNQNPANEKPTTEEIFCEVCGTKLSEFQQKGMFGCAQDYDTFQSILPKVFQRLHLACKHVGKVPRYYQKARELHKLREQLQEAISKEWYEKANEINKQIKTLEEQ